MTFAETTSREADDTDDTGASHPVNLQFYPTSDALADRLVRLFKNKGFSRVLDACAGTGALAQALWRANEQYMSRNTIPIDAVELDPRHHPALRAKGCAVVGLDFLEFEGGAVFSHVVSNPPFAQGAKHVLKAWDMLFEGEIAAIVNAETLRKPISPERRRLAALIHAHGSVQFVKEAFKGPDVERAAEVEVALVHLVKPAVCAEDWIGPVIAQLSASAQPEEDLFRTPNELALPNSFVTNQCIAFRQAVKAMRESVRADAVASHFAARIGMTMADLSKPEGAAIGKGVGGDIREAYSKAYGQLKDRAWTSILRSTDVMSRLSANVQKQAQAQFEQIKALDFCEVNVHSFLLGLVQSQPEMQVEMALDVFDQIGRHHTDNTVLFRGWRSNDRHRGPGWRIRTTRFILPGHATELYQSSLSWESRRMLADFDSVFAMLDGRQAPEVSLVQIFESEFRRLRDGERLSSTYFDVRYYPGIGTIHFFARDKKIIDRLNRVVGRKRCWLPPDASAGHEAFWKQYDAAEKLDGEIRKKVSELHRTRSGRGHSRWNDPVRDCMLDSREESAVATALVDAAIDTVLEKHGLLQALTDERSQFADLPLLAA